MKNPFKGKAFDIEHALVMYAKSFVTIPAFLIYEDEQIAPLLDQIRHCHIYLIGLTPKLALLGVTQDGRDLVTSLEVLGKRYDLHWPMPADMVLKGNPETGWYVEDSAGSRWSPSEATMSRRLAVEHNAVGFDVLYIGQALGEDGSRNALDRLKKHETLQKIAVKGIPDGYQLTILMLAVEPAHQLVTIINPWAKDKTQSSERINKGLDKLFGTNEAERTTLYEASLIRYFQPPFNKEFKNSFPSTNMKLLAECYDKDFSAVVAEINIDGLPFKLFSAAAPRTATGVHIAKHDLHNDEARRVFFT
ncbi:hypothetical protein ACVME8_007829 [Bradyrhizobium diazoefficiens]